MRIIGDFVPIYIPEGDVFPGPDSERLGAGIWYEDWVPNDHTFIRATDGRWHGFGITAPYTPAPNIHEGEWLSFHITSPAPSLGESLQAGAWVEHPKVLVPAHRPGERKEFYAPFAVERNGVYFLFYGPIDMRLATSSDLFHWQPRTTCFTQSGGARDPHVSVIDGLYHMVYVAGHSLFLRTSEDLVAWSEEPIEIFAMRRKGAPESPMILEHEGQFYLFWTIYDGTHGPYDNRTYVLRSDTPTDFRNAEEVTTLLAHCPELIEDKDGQWFISSAEWPRRGVSMARFEW
ncbi:MAG: family 43 glycosylhydrolase [Planctomycetes bacterium]|nr:family 43 glycosylhydrolase [Planctomycetota bacterium]